MVHSLISGHYKVKRMDQFPGRMEKIKLFFTDIVIIKDGDFLLEEIKEAFKEFYEPVLFLLPQKTPWEKKLINILPKDGILITSFKEKDEVKKTKEIFTFGFNREADFYISNVQENEGISFKLDYKGSSIPVRLREGDRRKVLNFAGALALGALLDINLVDMTKERSGLQKASF